MSGPQIPREFGRTAFGLDPAGYHAARPGYPEWVYEQLRSRCGLGKGTATFEIGAGTGTATGRLLELGADPLVAIEPDARLADYLRRSHAGKALTVIQGAFDEADLEDATFDLGVSATAFHWLDEDAALRRIARLLRPGGWWAAVWNVFGDDSRPDPFHEATWELLQGQESPSMGERGIPYALDIEARTTALERAGGFELIEAQTVPWSLVLTAEQTVALYATYSNIVIRPDREAVLQELGRIARDEFNDRVVRNMVTSLYTARRAG